MKSLNDWYKENIRLSQSDRNQEKANANSLFNSQVQSADKLYQGATLDTKKSYSDSYRDNAVQKLINERQVAESMANMGLTNSGLNRTQQTAVQLSYANNKAYIDRQKQAQVDALARELTAKKAEIEQNRLSTIAGIDSTYNQNAWKNAVSSHNTEVEEANKAAMKAAELENEWKIATYKANAENKNNDIQSLYTHLSDEGTDPDYAAMLIDSYCQKYDVNPKTDATVLAFLKKANMNLDDLNNYKTKGTAYISNSDYATGKAKGNYVKWDYKTAGTQDYVIKIKKNTFNWFWGVDKNDVVDIYYPDGVTLLKSNVELKDLTKKTGLALSDVTKGNQGNIVKVPLNLTKEDLD